MKALIIALFAISTTVIVDAQLRQSGPVDTGKKVVCVYNSTSFTREGQYKDLFSTLHLKIHKSRVAREKKNNINTIQFKKRFHIH